MKLLLEIGLEPLVQNPPVVKKMEVTFSIVCKSYFDWHCIDHQHNMVLQGPHHHRHRHRHRHRRRRRSSIWRTKQWESRHHQLKRAESYLHIGAWSLSECFTSVATCKLASAVRREGKGFFFFSLFCFFQRQTDFAGSVSCCLGEKELSGLVWIICFEQSSLSPIWANS